MTSFYLDFETYGTFSGFDTLRFFYSFVTQSLFVGLVRCALVPSYTLGLRKSAVKMALTAPRLPSFLCTALDCLDCPDSPTKKGKSASPSERSVLALALNGRF